MKSEIERDFAENEPADGQQEGDLTGGKIPEQQAEGAETIDGLEGIDGFDREHRGAERAVAGRADHIAIPELGLQKPAEPAAALTQEGERAGGCRGFGARTAKHRAAPKQALLIAIAAQPVDQFIILDQTIGIEAADLLHRAVAKAREGAGDQQQAIEAHPGEAAKEIADIFIGLEIFEELRLHPRPALRGEHAGGGDQVRIGGETIAHGAEGIGVEQGVSIDGDEQIGGDMVEGRIEGAGFAAMGEAQPAQTRLDRAGCRDYPERRGSEGEGAFEQQGAIIIGAIIGEEDRLGRIALRGQACNGRGEGGRFVIGGDDDGDRLARSGCGQRWRGGMAERQGLPEGEGE